jgi:hypothetical protein
MRKWLVIILIFIFIFIVYKKKKQDQSVNLTTYKNIDSLQIENNPWELLLNIEPKDSIHIYKVIWDQKYGATKINYCMAIFENKKAKQYKLIAPWFNSIIIEGQNISNINFEKIEKKSMPEGIIK